MSGMVEYHQDKQREVAAARALVGRLVRFAHQADEASYRVTAAVDGRLLDVRGTDLGSAFEEVAYVGPGATRPATAANRPGGRRLRELLAEGG